MTARATVVGDPVGHSLSPLLHGHWIRALGLEARYDACRVRQAGFSEYVARAFADPAFAGMNVTLPHKQAALRLADTASATARQVGAANLLVRRDGGLYADNTDVQGFLAPLLRRRPLAFWRHKKIVVVGAGGAARAVLAALTGLDATRIIVLNRTDARAITLAEGQKRVCAKPWQNRQEALRDTVLLVNASAAGLAEKHNLDLLPRDLKSDALVYDLVYRPEQTRLLQQARAAGYDVLGGLAMLIAQARPSFAAFFGVLPPQDDEAPMQKLRQAMEAQG